MILFATGVLVGSVGINAGNMCAWAAGDSEVAGEGAETAKLFTDFALDVLGVHRVFLKVLDGNVKARRSYEKAGFVYVGTFRDMVKLDGEFHDVVFMAKINGGSENE